MTPHPATPPASPSAAATASSPDTGTGLLRSPLALFLWATVAAFGAYFCMYGVRRPFAVAAYEGTPELWGVAYKTALITAQVFGYTISKFVGIKVVSEMKPAGRALAIVGLVGFAELALLGFALVPAPWNVTMMFLNGLPLGMVFGLVMGFLEGRRQSEAMLAGLCCSFIVADGVVRSVGAQFLAWGMSPFWMPSATGLVFFVPLLVFVWALSRVPAPDRGDESHRSRREAMDGAARSGFFRKYAPGLVVLVVFYLMITVLRLLRSDFAPELWKSMGVTAAPSMYATTETLVGLGVAAVFALTVWIRDNRRAFFTSLVMGMAGFALAGAALLGINAGAISPFAFMVLLGIALYLPYTAVHVTVFERLLAVTRDKANIGFLMYLVDAFGYLGYVGMLLGKNYFKAHGHTLTVFHVTAWTVAGVGVAGSLFVLWYFARHPALRRGGVSDSPAAPAPATVTA